MAPTKRKRAVHKGGPAPANPIRVTCPACQKAVPSFFVNSHLDLECQVLKSCAPPERPAPSPSGRPHVGSKPPPSLDQLQGGTIKIEESITKSSRENGKTRAPSLLNCDEAKSEDKTDEDIATRITAHKKCAIYDEDADNVDEVGGWVFHAHSDISLNDSVSFTVCEPENAKREGHCSGKTQSQSLGTVSPNLRCQLVDQRKCRGDRASTQLGTPGHHASISACFSSLPPQKLVAPKGLQVVENFISAEEEEHLVHCLDTDVSNPWKLSRTNGIHQGKAYGNHIYGDPTRRVVSQVNSPMPDFVLPFVKRMREEVPALKDFFPNEMNSIDYRKGDGHYLKAHMDDRQLSGKILVNLSLAGGCFMTYSRELGLKDTFRVNLLPRSLQILTGESRYTYTHGIQKNDIMDPRRVSMTFRQSVSTSQNIRPHQ